MTRSTTVAKSGKRVRDAVRDWPEAIQAGREGTLHGSCEAVDACPITTVISHRLAPISQSRIPRPHMRAVRQVALHNTWQAGEWFDNLCRW